MRNLVTPLNLSWIWPKLVFFPRVVLMAGFRSFQKLTNVLEVPRSMCIAQVSFRVIMF